MLRFNQFHGKKVAAAGHRAGTAGGHGTPWRDVVDYSAAAGSGGSVVAVVVVGGQWGLVVAW